MEVAFREFIKKVDNVKKLYKYFRMKAAVISKYNNRWQTKYFKFIFAQFLRCLVYTFLSYLTLQLSDRLSN